MLLFESILLTKVFEHGERGHERASTLARHVHDTVHTACAVREWRCHASLRIAQADTNVGSAQRSAVVPPVAAKTLQDRTDKADEAEATPVRVKQGVAAI